jgi:hypothetical protein
MGVVVQLFKDRRTAPPVMTRAQVAEHVSQDHGHDASPRMLLNDLHDLHDSLHEMPATHQHAAG